MQLTVICWCHTLSVCVLLIENKLSHCDVNIVKLCTLVWISTVGLVEILEHSVQLGTSMAIVVHLLLH